MSELLTDLVLVLAEANSPYVSIDRTALTFS